MYLVTDMSLLWYGLVKPELVVEKALLRAIMNPDRKAGLIMLSPILIEAAYLLCSLDGVCYGENGKGSASCIWIRAGSFNGLL